MRMRRMSSQAAADDLAGAGGAGKGWVEGGVGVEAQGRRGGARVARGELAERELKAERAMDSRPRRRRGSMTSSPGVDVCPGYSRERNLPISK